jgi:hypothetical protein
MDVPRRILVIGCGSVSQCTLPLLLKELDVAPSSISVLDMLDNRDRIADVLDAGVRYEIGQITPENLDRELSGRVEAGDMVLDLAWNIDTCTIVDWCRSHGVRYLNTSTELWDPLSRRGHDAPARPHALCAPHGAAPDDRSMGRQQWSVGRGRARRQSGARVAFHEAGSGGDRGRLVGQRARDPRPHGVG